MAGATETPSLDDKRNELRRVLEDMGSAIVAFSGGVDSSYLAAEAHLVLGDRALAVTGESPSYSEHHRELALGVVERFGLRHRFVSTEEARNPAYLANGPDRCFHCKNELYSRLSKLAREEDYRFVLDGSNADDRSDYRPGREAARRLGVRSPLDEVGLGKNEIRRLSGELGLPTASEPASACLSSRIPYRTPITIEALSVVERGEARLRELGFRQMRVRHHDSVARLELAPEELSRALEPAMREKLVTAFKALGYRFVTVDLEGYRMGSLNEALGGTGASTSTESRAGHPSD